MLESLIDSYGEGAVLMGAGLGVGLLFGAAAQHSRFCLRAAAAELAEGKASSRLSIWLITFFAALAFVQGAIALGWLDASGSRQLAATGSLSGAIIGGLMFGCGMILARGCASRLLVLSATGNLRAIITGLVLTLVAQSALRGALAPARETLTGLWLVPGGDTRNLGVIFGLSPALIAVIGGIALALVLVLAIRRGQEVSRVLAAALVGLAVALGWIATYAVSQVSFEVIPISSVTFTGPATDTLMGLVNSTSLPLGFGVGLVPGVFIGSGVAAILSREFHIQRFGADTPMERYLIGAALMGFGAMLAGGCAVGAGVSGGAVLALTAWVAVFFMWVGAMATKLAMGKLDLLRPRATPAE
jgi:uncharacterized membrane protein YedE/YeeE